jgi:glucoamylase
MQPLAEWIERQYRDSAIAMLRSVSPLDIVKSRPGFGQTVVPLKGSIVASPVLGAYDPEPDYFFHWYRDSALIIDAMRLLYLHAVGKRADVPVAAEELLGHFADFVRFSTTLRSLDGRTVAQSPTWRSSIAPDYLQFVRDHDDLSAVHGEAIDADTRVNPDGTLDISKWPRPQNDGPPLRALSLVRWLTAGGLDHPTLLAAEALLRADLDFVHRRWREPCFDIWEEERGFHYYTLRVAAAALSVGADWLERRADTATAATYRSDCHAIAAELDGFWSERRQYFRSRVLVDNASSLKELDIAVILAALHSGANENTHSVFDPRMHCTLSQLEVLFEAEYAINRERSRASPGAPALGRYAQDRYYSGGAYYFSTLGAAEFCFRAATRGPDQRSLISRGDAFLATVRAFTPANGELSEQFDQTTGVQRSAKQLAWSHAAFITCATARREVILRAG